MLLGAEYDTESESLINKIYLSANAIKNGINQIITIPENITKFALIITRAGAGDAQVAGFAQLNFNSETEGV